MPEKPNPLLLTYFLTVFAAGGLVMAQRIEPPEFIAEHIRSNQPTIQNPNIERAQRLYLTHLSSPIPKPSPSPSSSPDATPTPRPPYPDERKPGGPYIHLSQANLTSQ